MYMYVMIVTLRGNIACQSSVSDASARVAGVRARHHLQLREGVLHAGRDAVGRRAAGVEQEEHPEGDRGSGRNSRGDLALPSSSASPSSVCIT